MAKPREHLKNAPVREALIDIRINPQLDLDAIQQAAKGSSAEFSSHSDIWAVSAGLSFHESGAPKAQSNRSKFGTRLDSTSSPHVVQYRVNGYTFSHLAPYTNWSSMRELALRYWSPFAKLAANSRVTRVAVRYVNALKLPPPPFDLALYLTAAPQVPEDLPQQMRGFLQQVNIASPSDDYGAVITQASEGTTAKETTVLLDLDVFMEVQELGPESQEIWEILDRLRSVKNEMFFQHLTETAVDLFV